jgi:integrase
MKFHHALTDAKLRSVKKDADLRRVKPAPKDDKWADGEGLYLLVKANGAMYWRYNYKVAGSAKTMALGTYPDTTLKAARELHSAARAIVKTGADPVAQRRVEKVQAEEQAAGATTFKEIARQWRAVMAPEGKRSAKTAARDERMVRYLNAEFGDMPARDLKVANLSNLLDKYEQAGKFETRVRVQGAAIAIMGFGVGRGWLDHNPFLGVNYTAAFTAPEDNPRPAVTDPESFGHLLRKVEHFEGREGNLTGMALELLALTFARPGDVAKAEWAHFDRDVAKKWSVPPDQAKMRTKRKENKSPRAGKAHEIPLARQTEALLRRLHKLTGHSRFLFPGRQSARTMSENTMLAALNALGYQGIHCPHGFRSSASTLLNEARIMVDGRKVLLWPDQPALIELQLDHDDDSTRAIYNRGGCWDDRVELMQFWADKIDQLRAAKPTDHKAKLDAVA